MSYEVVWSARAERQLAAIWLGSSHRATIAAAARDIDREIAALGIHAGESREHDEVPIVASLPLIADVHVDQAYQRAAVVKVRQV